MQPEKPTLEKSQQPKRTFRFGSVALTAAMVVACGFVKMSFGPQAISTASAAEPSPWVHLSGEKPALSLDQTPFAGQPAENNAYAHTDGSRTDWVPAGSTTP